MRLLLLLAVGCIGYAMENNPPAAINTANEQQPLLNIQLNRENPIRQAAIDCADRYGGIGIVCCSLLCIGGLVGVGCWHAGAVGAAKASSVVVGTMQ
jgi:hypothetical protein